jgi:hypothetical protein
VSQALFVLVMVVTWQCVEAVGGVDVHVVYLINISRIKKKKKKNITSGSICLKLLRLRTICYIEPVLAFGTEQDIIVNSCCLSPQRSQRSSCSVSVSKSALQEVLS